MKTTIKVTIPTKNELSYFTIEFLTSNFDQVIESVASIKTIDELQKSDLWIIK